MIDGQNHQDRADLGDAQEQGHVPSGAPPAARRRNQGNACRERLGKRRDDDAERHAAYRLPCKDDDLLATLVRRAAVRSADTRRRPLRPSHTEWRQCRW